MNKTTRNIVTAAVIGALYAVLTMVLAPISYGPVQCRISEVLCILPFFMPSTTWGLFFGCAIANIASSAGLPDIIFGSLATLIACLCISWCGKHNKKALACLMPVIWNGLIVGAMLTVVVVIPSGCEKICSYAFRTCKKLRQITIPDSVTTIEPDAFLESPNVTICCKKGSAAESYAIENGLKHKT